MTIGCFAWQKLESGFPQAIYTWGGFAPPPPYGEGQVQGDKVLMGGLMRGDIDLMGGGG